MENRNTQSKEGFLKTVTHPRKNELARMIFDGKTPDEMLAAGFGRLNVLEMARQIRHNVEGMEGLDVDIPRGEEVAATEEVIPSAEAETTVADTAAAQTTGEGTVANDENTAGENAVETGNTEGAATGTEVDQTAAPVAAPGTEVASVGTEQAAAVVEENNGAQG